ncbi:hypothetical protein K437DRAFT_255378 [Tilletiaria anomala UBC 951]|uniref:Uncharacterized protein n=1 Tax=Tilletiaria anomala (strain ATCC 24038 / CBS 436.72 / UBC 951) TaxID=1037660 RepID=A0A066W5K2_TILAU|nr:uncharacterized protein K437DRAFT_255378 [Tilletiaria anomala UBC 951]KDN49247.1 hypothetical protein K437DRAFT_255378 [Tilletiaria anomala UBC 951]
MTVPGPPVTLEIDAGSSNAPSGNSLLRDAEWTFRIWHPKIFNRSVGSAYASHSLHPASSFGSSSTLALSTDSKSSAGASTARVPLVLSGSPAARHADRTHGQQDQDTPSSRERESLEILESQAPSRAQTYALDHGTGSAGDGDSSSPSYSSAHGQGGQRSGQDSSGAGERMRRVSTKARASTVSVASPSLHRQQYSQSQFASTVTLGRKASVTSHSSQSQAFTNRDAQSRNPDQSALLAFLPSAGISGAQWHDSLVKNTNRSGNGDELYATCSTSSQYRTANAGATTIARHEDLMWEWSVDLVHPEQQLVQPQASPSLSGSIYPAATPNGRRPCPTTNSTTNAPPSARMVVGSAGSVTHTVRKRASVPGSSLGGARPQTSSTSARFRSKSKARADSDSQGGTTLSTFKHLYEVVERDPFDGSEGRCMLVRHSKGLLSSLGLSSVGGGKNKFSFVPRPVVRVATGIDGAAGSASEEWVWKGTLHESYILRRYHTDGRKTTMATLMMSTNAKFRLEIVDSCPDPMLVVATTYPILRMRREVYARKFTTPEELERLAAQTKIDPFEEVFYSKKKGQGRAKLPQDQMQEHEQGPERESTGGVQAENSPIQPYNMLGANLDDGRLPSGLTITSAMPTGTHEPFSPAFAASAVPPSPSMSSSRQRQPSESSMSQSSNLHLKLKSTLPPFQPSWTSELSFSPRLGPRPRSRSSTAPATPDMSPNLDAPPTPSLAQQAAIAVAFSTTDEGDQEASGTDSSNARSKKGQQNNSIQVDSHVPRPPNLPPALTDIEEKQFEERVMVASS